MGGRSADTVGYMKIPFVAIAGWNYRKTSNKRRISNKRRPPTDAGRSEACVLINVGAFIKSFPVVLLYRPRALTLLHYITIINHSRV